MEPRFFGTPSDLETIVRKKGIAGTWGEDSTGKRVFKDSAGGVLNWTPITGSVWFQGNVNSPLLHLFSDPAEVRSSTFSTPKVNSVFVVHGHDHDALGQVETLLNDLGVQPRVLIRSSGSGNTLIEALEEEILHSANGVDFGIVILTPDDQGYSIKEGAASIQPRARQNVILEMGMLISKLKRRKVAILMNETNGPIEIPSDLDGVIYLSYKDSIVRETGIKLVQRFREAGMILDDARVARVLETQ